MMKKRNWLLIAFAILFMSATFYAGNEYRYQIKAWGGLSVGQDTLSGSDVVKMDSITYTSGILRIYNGVTNMLSFLAPLESPQFLTQISIGAASITSTVAGYLDPTSSIQGQFDAINAELVDTVDLKSLTPMLTDTTNLGMLGCGAGLAGDTLLIDDDYNGYSLYRVPQDSTRIAQAITTLSAGDSVNFYIVSGTVFGTPIDTLATIAADGRETITSSFSEDTYVKDRLIWIEMGAEVPTRKPVIFWVLLQGGLIRNE